MFLHAKITSIARDAATLVLDDGQTLVVPMTAIEGTPKQGGDVSFVITAPGAEDAGRQQLSRDLLNTLLSA